MNIIGLSEKNLNCDFLLISQKKPTLLALSRARARAVATQDDLKFVEDSNNKNRNSGDETGGGGGGSSELDLSYLDWWSKYFNSIATPNSRRAQSVAPLQQPSARRRLRPVRSRKSMVPIKEEIGKITIKSKPRKFSNFILKFFNYTTFLFRRF